MLFAQLILTHLQKGHFQGDHVSELNLRSEGENPFLHSSRFSETFTI